MIRQLRGQSAAKKLLRSPVLRIHGNIEVAPSEGTHLTGEKSDEGQTYPLAEAEWSLELLLCVAKSGLYGIRGGYWQTHTSLGEGKAAAFYKLIGRSTTALADYGTPLLPNAGNADGVRFVTLIERSLLGCRLQRLLVRIFRRIEVPANHFFPARDSHQPFRLLR